jgi:hypothetical protein
MSAAWDPATRQLGLSRGCLHYGAVSTLTAAGSSDNTGVSAIVYRPTLSVPNTVSPRATWEYPWISPPSRSRR